MVDTDQYIFRWVEGDLVNFQKAIAAHLEALSYGYRLHSWHPTARGAAYRLELEPS